MEEMRGKTQAFLTIYTFSPFILRSGIGICRPYYNSWKAERKIFQFIDNTNEIALIIIIHNFFPEIGKTIPLPVSFVGFFLLSVVST